MEVASIPEVTQLVSKELRRTLKSIVLGQKSRCFSYLLNLSITTDPQGDVVSATFTHRYGDECGDVTISAIWIKDQIVLIGSPKAIFVDDALRSIVTMCYLLHLLNRALNNYTIAHWWLMQYENPMRQKNIALAF